MPDLNQILIVVGFFILLASEIACIYYFYAQNDVALSNREPENIASDLVVILILLFGIAYLVLAFMNLGDRRVSVLLFAFSVFVALVVCWAIRIAKRMKDQSMETLEALICVLEAGDPNMDGHSLHVHNLTMLLYDYLPTKLRRGINKVNLQYASLFFDIGKYGVPGRVLNKTGKLGNEEWKLMKRHPEICVRILESIGGYRTILNWITYHHERMDGSGYHQLKGSEIPVASRMIALADTYSSITMQRAYKPTLTYEDAIAELKLVSGSQLDEQLVDIFCDIPMNKVEACMEDVRRRMKLYEEESIHTRG